MGGSLTRLFKKCALYDDQRLLLDAVLRGHGIACMPWLLAADDVASGKLVILPDYPRFPGITWWLSRVAGQPRSSIVVDVFNWLLAQGNT